MAPRVWTGCDLPRPRCSALSGCVVFRDELDVSVRRATRSHEVALARLPVHVKRVKVAAKRDLNFWVWMWVLLNLGRGCAIMVCTTGLYGDYAAVPWDGSFVANMPGARCHASVGSPTAAARAS